MRNKSKINTLLHSVPYGTVLTSSWLLRNGYSHSLQQRYKQGGWLEKIGIGAVKRAGEKVSAIGAIFALQNQLGLSVHIGSKSSLALTGRAHYLEMGESNLVLFGGADEQLPRWFSQSEWGARTDYHATSFLPSDIGLEEYSGGDFTIRISGAARAVLESLYLSSRDGNIVECYELLEGMAGLRPQLVQSLLEQCSSVRVKRLFLFMAEKAGHSWFKYLEPEQIDLGKGTRSLVNAGAYVQKYDITVPKELIEDGKDI